MKTFSGRLKSASEEGVFIGLGANLSTPEHPTPKEVLIAALAMLPPIGIAVERRSRWYRSAPVPASDQPWFTNAVVLVSSALSPLELMAALHQVEDMLGRRRGERWAARPIDLDLIAYGSCVVDASETDDALVLPHPRMHERAFVLLPLREIAPDWRHPKTGTQIDQLCGDLNVNQVARPFDDETELTA
jgi:2-amino-4-hydroxy-6-hydroxymethyldihydropteridine diphosphokinase